MSTQKRRLQYGKIEADFERTALIVHYAIITAIFENGEQVDQHKKSGTKTIRLGDCNAPEFTTKRFAREIVTNCKQIKQANESVAKVHELLLQLKSRPSKRFIIEDLMQRANAHTLANYIEKLYEEDVNVLLEGTAMLASVARHAINLQAVIRNEAGMNALKRVLKEEYKKKDGVVLNILVVFFCFSHFSDAHDRLKELDLPKFLIKLTGYYLAKFETIAYSLAEKKKKIKDVPEGEKIPETAIAEYKKTVGQVRKQFSNQDKILYFSLRMLLNFIEDKKIEHKLSRKLCPLLLSCLEKYNVNVITVTLKMLRKLSVYAPNKNAIVAGGILSRLQLFLSAPDNDITLPALQLFHNLSFDSEFRNKASKTDILKNLFVLLAHYHNEIEETGRVSPQYRLVLKCLYLQSQSLEVCQSIAEIPECINDLMLMIHDPDTKEPVAREFSALMVNLSRIELTCRYLMKPKFLRAILSQIARSSDSDLLKVIRNMAAFTYKVQMEMDEDTGRDDYRFKGLWSSIVYIFVKILPMFESKHEMLLEIAGCLANLTVWDCSSKVPFSVLVDQYDTIEFLQKNLVPSFVEDDLLMEYTQMIRNMIQDETCAEMFVGTGIMRKLAVLFAQKQGDMDLQMALLSCFNVFLLHFETAKELITETEVVSCICDMLTYPSHEINELVGPALDLIMDFDRQYGSGEVWCEIRAARFSHHNQVWIDRAMMDSYSMDGAGSVGSQGSLREPTDREDFDDEEQEFVAGGLQDWYWRMGEREEAVAFDTDALGEGWSTDEYSMVK
eukprot:TRINITY_DN2337_c0_g1_i1.p1 TRINITY_DN2337_c0_g1~~TRINITY_DN2337_c0_g1_i1.p1  ORF type:complete len:784 (+),score=200.21 TRINITY_DN2337_c0_g1_i1:93-2444(+)